MVRTRGKSLDRSPLPLANCQFVLSFHQFTLVSLRNLGTIIPFFQNLSGRGVGRMHLQSQVIIDLNSVRHGCQANQNTCHVQHIQLQGEFDFAHDFCLLPAPSAQRPQGVSRSELTGYRASSRSVPAMSWCSGCTTYHVYSKVGRQA